MASRRASKKLRSIWKYGVFALIVVWSLGPMLLLLLGSLKQPAEVLAVPPKLFFQPTLDNYLNLFRHWPQYPAAFANSLIITVSATLLTVFVSGLAGWVYSRHKSPMLTATAFFMILVRMIPAVVLVVPLFPVINWLGLNDTHIVLVLLYSAFFVSVCTWIMKVFVDQIPRELEETAQIDGAGLWQTLCKVIFPLVAPGAAAASVFIFVFAWNEFVTAFIFTTTNAKTAPILLAEMMTGNVNTGVDWGVVFAGTCVQLLPIMIFVLLMHRYLIAGLTAGGVKG
jgi:multiple sugar transport system permease protein